MKRKNRTILTLFAIFVLFNCQPAFSTGENMLHTSAGRTYAGYGYTHGAIPVSEGNGGYYDNDIMRYDINNLKRANYYYTQEDLEYHNRGGNSQTPNYNQYAQ